MSLPRSNLQRQGRALGHDHQPALPAAARVRDRPKTLWPDLDVTCSARTQSLADYIASIGDADRVLNMLVGDTQRIWVYADAGYAEPQAISNNTMDAYRRLVDAGYTRRLIDRTST